MELFRPEAEKLRKQIEGWLPHKQRELEATFGLGGQVDQTRFLAVAQRLKAKGYMADPPSDYLTITIKDAKSDINVRRDTLKNNTRFTISGSDAVEQYCREESLDGLEYDVILKTAIGNPSEDDLILEDYDMKFKVRREEERVKDEAIVTEIVKTWAKQKKAFRLIRRWTFQGDGCVFDLSMIRSNKRNASGAYIFTEKFSDGDYNIMNEKPTYEIEVELKHSPDLTDADKAMSKLIKAVGEVLRGLQKNTILIRKSQKKRALDAYKNLVESDLFRGVKPRTLEMKNFIAKRIPNVPNIRDGYNVTDKADGLRVLGFCDDKGELFMIDKAMNVYRTGLQNENCRNSLVDGEWITSIKDEQDPTIQRATQQLWLFDIYIAANKEKVDGLPFYTAVKDAPTRYKAMTDWYSNWIKDGPKSVMGGLQASNRLIVKLKTFEFAEKGNKEIFEKASRMLKRKTEYNTDGLIFTSNSAALPAADSNFREQFKWKPAEDNTIDFLVRLEKDKNGEDIVQSGIHPLTGNIVTYKTLILKVGSTMDPSCANPRDTILYERSYPRGGCKSDRFMKDKSGKYRAVVFNPTEYADPMASICRVEVQLDPDTQLNYILTDKSKEPIQDKSIVEMRFDMKRPEGWRWVPVRVRIDKTEKLEKGELSGSLNADFTAEGVWNSIHNPITRGMISTGNEAPLREELDEDDADDRLVDLSKPYFERKANKQQLQSVEGLRNFHKHYIKGDMLLRPTLQGEGKYILDLAVGEAADINRWISNKAGFIYGMDIAAKGILDSHRGAYTKYINRLSENAGLPEDKQLQIPPMIFGIGDVSKSLATGEAGFNEEEANILRTVFGKVAPTGPVPPFVEHQGKDKLKEGADVVACMFALHYFFKDKETFQGLMKNIDQHLAVDGYFVACFFDGQKVFDLLKNKNEGESVSGTDRNTAIWKITKQYSNSTLPTDDTAFGLAIQNKFISIGAEHREYLVPFELLEAKMREIGCMLIPDAELKALGLPSSTETFDVSYKRATQEAKRAGKEVFPMIKAVQDYSFLNRWCIFKRYGKAMLNDDEEEEVMAKSLQTVKEEMKQETKPAEVKRPQSLAWQDVPSSGNDKTVAAVDEVKAVEERRVKEVDVVNVAKSALTMGKPLNEKPMKEGLASAMGDIKGVTVAVEPPSKEYEPEKIFAFGAIEAEEDARYLAPYAPFEIIDNEDPANPVTYPSIQHFLAAMEYKKATNKPGYAVTVFSNTGSIHQDFIRKLLIQKAKGTPAEIKIKEQELLLTEAKDVALHTPARMFQKYSLKYDDALWATLKDKYLEIAYKARYQKDSKFREILRKLRESDKYLLYRPTAKITTELGGILKIVRKNKKKMVKVEGENQLGKLLMSLAGFPGFEKIEPGLVGEEEE